MFFNQARAKAFMQECGLDALITTSHVNITYSSPTTSASWPPPFGATCCSPAGPPAWPCRVRQSSPWKGNPLRYSIPCSPSKGRTCEVATFTFLATLTSAELLENRLRIHGLLMTPP